MRRLNGSCSQNRPQPVIDPRAVEQRMSEVTRGYEAHLERNLAASSALEESVREVLSKRMPKGYEYGQDGKLYILPRPRLRPDPAREESPQMEQLEVQSCYPLAWDEIFGEDSEQLCSLWMKCMLCVYVTWCIIYMYGWLSFGIAISGATVLACVIFGITGYHINFGRLFPVDREEIEIDHESEDEDGEDQDNEATLFI